MVTKTEIQELLLLPLEELTEQANRIRIQHCGNRFDFCTILNAKSGKCSEDCKYCAQSIHYETACKEYPLLNKQQILADAKQIADHGIRRYSIVTSGKKLNSAEVSELAESIAAIKETTDLHVCGSLGILDSSQYQILREAGLSRVHNNLETSRTYFPSVCSTHTYQDKLDAIAHAKASNMNICSGGIIGIGETMEDRIDLALQLKQLDIKSVPINILSPIKGTPYENNPKLPYEEVLQTIAIFRFILPDAYIRLAGGRNQLPDHGKRCFQSGANAAITGNFLTTTGSGIEEDLQMIRSLGFVLT